MHKILYCRELKHRVHVHVRADDWTKTNLVGSWNIAGCTVATSRGRLVDRPVANLAWGTLNELDEKIMTVWQLYHNLHNDNPHLHCSQASKSLKHVNSSDAGDGIFRLWRSILCLLIHWLLKSPVHHSHCENFRAFTGPRMNLASFCWF